MRNVTSVTPLENVENPLPQTAQSDHTAYALPEEIREAPPLPPTPDLRTVFSGGVFTLGLLFACYFAGAILLPVILAMGLKFVLQPIMRLFDKMFVPRQIGAFLVIFLLLAGVGRLGAALSTPLANWAQQLPDGIGKIQSRMHALLAPIKATQNVIQNAEGLASTSATKPVMVAVQGSRLSDRLLTNTQSLLSGLGETLLVLFFLLASGDTFLRRLIEILPRFQDKKQAVLITQQVEADISAYLATITLSNTIVGVATACAMALCRLPDPVLWGTVAFLLNYVPIVGPIGGVVLFLLAGSMTSGPLSAALLPACLYMAIHLIESLVITPTLLSKRFTLNPVLVVLGVIFLYWMWGVVGAILATPLLAVTKIICDRTQRLAAVGHFMEG